jgi:GNS1/SUR4 family
VIPHSSSLQQPKVNPHIFFFLFKGFMATYCDQDGTFWNEGGLGAWATAFYISKYYEFVDTWILIFKGKDASFLQVYHHAGIAFIFWAAVASRT